MEGFEVGNCILKRLSDHNVVGALSRLWWVIQMDIPTSLHTAMRIIKRFSLFLLGIWPQL